MSLISAAICPHPMALIPDVGGEAGASWEQLRRACADAVRQLAAPVWDGKRSPSVAAPHLIVIVGGDELTRRFEPSGAYGSLRSSGVNWEYGWGSDSDVAQPLPLSLTVGYWLLMSSKIAGIIVADIEFQAISFDASPQQCAEVGQDLAGRAKKVAMLVMAEGSTCMGATARTCWADQAKQCDAKVLRALEHADVDALSRLNAAEFRATATGRAAWQVLAGAAGGHPFQGRIHLGTEESDLGYFVASWTSLRRSTSILAT
jgi:hypothetical protein